MEPAKTFEHYPFRMILVSFLVNVSIYTLGIVILSGFGCGPAAVFALFCAGGEISIMKKSCVECYYYGRWCALGRGRIAALLFKQGDPARFAARCISWNDLLPDMLVLFIPLAGGIALSITNFAWSRLVMIAALAALSFGGNYFVRSTIACKYCKQRELGCPAEKFFSRRRTEKNTQDSLEK